MNSKCSNMQKRDDQVKEEKKRTFDMICTLGKRVAKARKANLRNEAIGSGGPERETGVSLVILAMLPTWGKQRGKGNFRRLLSGPRSRINGTGSTKHRAHALLLLCMCERERKASFTTHNRFPKRRLFHLCANTASQRFVSRDAYQNI